MGESAVSLVRHEYSEVTCPSAILSSENSHDIVAGRPAANRLSYGTVLT
jgi:hypothetical protein